MEWYNHSMNIIVVRHGETNMNKENRLQGCKGPDMPLNEEGRRDVAKLADGLLITPLRIFASPLKRTQETAHIINERFGVPIVNVPELMERDFGSLSGKLRSEINPELVESDLEGRYDYRPYGGESVEDVRTRLIHFLKTLPLSTDETILIVTHRGIIRILYDLYPADVIGEEIIPASKHVFHITALPKE